MTDTRYVFKIWTPTGVIIEVPDSHMPQGWQVWDKDLAASAQMAATHLGLKVTMEKFEVCTAEPESNYVQKNR